MLPCRNDLQNARTIAESYAISKPNAVESIERVVSNLNMTGVPIAMAQSSMDMDCVQSTSESPMAPVALQFPKTRKLSFERSEPRKCVYSSQCLLLVFSSSLFLSFLLLFCCNLHFFLNLLIFVMQVCSVS